MDAQNQSDIETICKQLFDEFHDILSWKWDDWIGAFLAEFDIEREMEVHTVLDKYLPISWDSSNIKTAPQVIQSLDKYLGGIRSAQYLFSSDPSGGAFVFCAWWPWSNGTTISIRIAPFDRNLSKQEVDKLKRQLIALVGI
jgi:hypothetical protein